MVATFFMQVYSFDSIAAVGGGFFAGILIGYALKKVVKLAAVVIGLFFSGIVYLQYQQILNINWDKLQAASQNTLSTLANALTLLLFYCHLFNNPLVFYVDFLRTTSYQFY